MPDPVPVQLLCTLLFSYHETQKKELLVGQLPQGNTCKQFSPSLPSSVLSLERQLLVSKAALGANSGRMDP